MNDTNRPDRPVAGACGADPWRLLDRFTPARIALGRAGGSVPTRPLLEFQLAHAQARDAVLRDLDAAAFGHQLAAARLENLQCRTMACDRATFIARPDLGRMLDADSRTALRQRRACDGPYDCVFVVADGLSALAIERHAAQFLSLVCERIGQAGWRVAPICVVNQGRVAVGDEVGALLAARMTVLLVGERPGLSSPDSLGVYLTWDPRPGRTNAERNCISNIRPPHGLSYQLAAHKLCALMIESRRRGLSGVGLQEDACAPLENEAAGEAPGEARPPPKDSRQT